MNWHLVKLYAMKIKCKTVVIPLSIFQNVYRYLSLFVKMALNGAQCSPNVMSPCVCATGGFILRYANWVIIRVLVIVKVSMVLGSEQV